MQHSMQGLGEFFSAIRQKLHSGGASGQPPTATTASPAYKLREENLGRLHRAAAHGDLAWLRRWRWWLKRVGMDQRDEQQRTPLHLACANGHEDVVTYLVRKNCQLNLVDSFKRSPLMKAVECQQEKCVAILLEHGADLNLADADGNTALHLAVLSPNKTVAGLLLEHDANIDAQNQDGFTPLCLAASRHQEQMVEFLWKKVVDKHAQDHHESGDLTDSPLREGEVAPSFQELQDFLLASLKTHTGIKRLVEHLQRLEIERATLEAVVQQQSSRIEALQRDLQASASVADPYRKLENECYNCMQQKAENRRLQEELSTMREKCEELEKNKCQLEEEVAKLKCHIKTNMVDRRQAEQYKREVADLSQKLEIESKRCTHLVTQNHCLQEELSTMHESHEELKKSKWQLKEEVAKLKYNMETNMVDRCQAEQYKRELEEVVTQELRHDLEEFNLFWQTQAVSLDKLQQVRGSVYEMKHRYLQWQMEEMRKTYQDSRLQHECLHAELERFKKQYMGEVNFRKSPRK